jgi:hypothetical protein
MLFCCIFVSCNNDTQKKQVAIRQDKQIKEANMKTVNYVLDKDLKADKYTDFEGYYPAEGIISSAELAVQIAEQILKKIYGEKIIENEKPFSVNLENGIWLIEGSLPDGYRKGGSAYIEIRQSNGEVIKLIHSK